MQAAAMQIIYKGVFQWFLKLHPHPGGRQGQAV